ncbi:twin-arginine translocase subunit TatC [Nocardioides sp. GXZ039]|uniref:twin-arginine translocase subunit TatC n=1 Tax=Nocardioides sp. GXZ039 TaxID=3136018 RepID=UPI0030F40C80
MTAAISEPPIARGTMPLAGHLREARRRSLRAATALLIAVVAGYLVADPILDLLRRPIDELAASREATLNYDTVTAAFDLKLKIAVFAGVVLSSPVWIAELFAFVTPGLTRRERRATYGFLAAALPLFAAGCTFGFLIFPHMVRVLAGFSATEDATILTATYYVDFVLRVVLATGIAFVLPVFVVALNLLGILSARTLRRSWRIIVVLIALFSALVTPAADMMSMFFVALPMTVLFGAALVISHVHDHRAAGRHERGAACSA